MSIRPHCFRLLQLPLAALLLGAVPVPAVAQLATEYRWSVSGGASLVFPFELYDGDVRVRSSGLPAGGTQPWEGARPFAYLTQYRESADQLTELWTSAEILRNNSHFLSLRGRLGAGTVHSSVRGAVLPQAPLPGDLRWIGVDLLAGFQLAARRAEFRLFAGPSLLRGSVGGRERLAAGPAVVRVLDADSLFPMLVPWADRSWTAVGGVVGQALRVRATDRLTIGLAGEYRFAGIDFRGLEESHASAYRALGHGYTVDYESHTAFPVGLSLSVEWRVGTRRIEDPGDAAIAALDATRLEALAAGAGPVDWRDALPPEVRVPLLDADTAAAIAGLERLDAAYPNDPLILGTLGMLLAATAPAVESDFTDRVRAERLLERALMLDRNNPRYVMALGVLLEKKVMHTDARRVLTRGVAAAVNRPDEVTPDELAEMFFQRGVALEAWVMDFEDLQFVGQTSPELSRPAANDEFLGLDLDAVDPDDLLRLQELLHEIVAAEEIERMRDALERGVDLTPLIKPHRQAMLNEFHRAVTLKPDHLGAHRRIMATHARADEWALLAAQARAYSAAVPWDPWADIFLAMALYWTEPSAVTDSLFRTSLARLAPADRRIFEDLNVILPAADEGTWARLDEADRDVFRQAYWRMRDPLYISDYNERLAEHQARVAEAELLFGEPQRGRRGWETDRGQILVRYGPPDRITMRMERGEYANGRMITWYYPQPIGSFTFGKQLGRATVRFNDRSFQHAFDLKDELPVTFDPPFRHAGPLTAQVARFRGTEPERHEVVFYGQAPVITLAASPADTVVHGLTLLAGNALEIAGSERQRVPAGDGALNYRLFVSPGTYAYALEAMSAAGDRATSTRGRLEITQPVPGLAMSDLLLAHYAVPRAGVTDPISVRDLSYDPLRCLALPATAELSVAFELYGLTGEPGGLARYRVTIATDQLPPTGVLARALRGVRELLQPRADGTVTFVREVEIAGDRVVDWFEISLPERPDEPLLLAVEVTDLENGQSVRAERRLAPACPI